jgi:hypothetical protein
MQTNSVFLTIEFELLSIVRNEEIYVVFYVPLFGGKKYHPKSSQNSYW